MQDPGEDPGGGASGGSKPGPRIQIFEDLSRGPVKGESLAEYRKKVTLRLLKIAKEEERLAALRMDFRKKKDLYGKAWSSKRQTMKPELKELEEKVALQADLVSALKASSGAFKEKFSNEERFRAARKGLDTRGSQASASHVSPLIPDGVDGSAEVSPPIPPQQSQHVSQVELRDGGSGMMQFVKEMESPVREKSFKFSAESSDEEGDDKVEKVLKDRVREKPVYVESGKVC